MRSNGGSQLWDDPKLWFSKPWFFGHQPNVGTLRVDAWYAWWWTFSLKWLHVSQVFGSRQFGNHMFMVLKCCRAQGASKPQEPHKGDTPKDTQKRQLMMWFDRRVVRGSKKIQKDQCGTAVENRIEMPCPPCPQKTVLTCQTKWTNWKDVWGPTHLQLGVSAKQKIELLYNPGLINP